MHAREEIRSAIRAFQQYHGTIEGKIGLYVSLSFFLLWVIQATITLALIPNIRLPGTLRFETLDPYGYRGFIKVPCDGKYPYGFHGRLIVPGSGWYWALVCRDFSGEWHWKFD